MMTDPLAFMFSRLRYASRAGKLTVQVPLSNLKLRVAHILVTQGIAESVEKVDEKGTTKTINIRLRVRNNGAPVLVDIQRVSRPGARIFVDYAHIPAMKQNFGFSLLSTVQGLMTGFEARKRKIGGEVIGTVTIAG